MYGEHLLAEWIGDQLTGIVNNEWIAAHTIGSVIAIAVLTYFHIVVGEMVPKSIALQKAHRSILLIAPVMRVVQLFFYPLVLILNGIGNAALRVLRIDRHNTGGEAVRTADELAYIVRESQAGGLLRRESATVVQELLEFGELTAAQVMVPRVRVVGLDRTETWAEVRATMQQHPHSRYPVIDGDLDHIVGMVHVKDLVGGIPHGATVSTLPVRPIPFVPESATTEEVLTAMRTNRSQLVVVMDEHGGTAGIVSLEDLLEEVVGEMTENAHSPAEIERQGDGQLRVTGFARVTDVADMLGVVVEHPDVETISGLVLALLGRPAALGDVVEYEEIRVEVSAVEGRGVQTAVVTRRDG
jgi:CBS domain containing-hemolysin-like protein